MEFVQRRKLEYSSGPKTSSRDIESHRDVEKCARDSRRPHNPRHQTDNLSALGILIGIILVLVTWEVGERLLDGKLFGLGNVGKPMTGSSASHSINSPLTTALTESPSEDEDEGDDSQDSVPLSREYDQNVIIEHTAQSPIKFKIPPHKDMSNVQYDILFVGCYLPYSDGETIVNHGDYMYRDIWRREFWDKQIQFTHVAQITTAIEKISESRVVIFGGGGLLYNSLDRDHGAGELKLLNRWYEALKESGTPYAFASIGLQPKAYDKAHLDSIRIKTLDDGLFQISEEFIRGATFITARSPTDQRLFAEWNPLSYYFPDLGFALKKLQMAVAPVQPPKSRNLILTVGPIVYLRPVAKDLQYLIQSDRYTYYHIELSQGDRITDVNDFVNAGLPKPDKLVREQYLYDYDTHFAKTAYVFTSRFHGFVMAMLYQVPHIVPLLDTWKLKTFANHEDLEELSLGSIQMIRNAL